MYRRGLIGDNILHKDINYTTFVIGVVRILLAKVDRVD